MANVIKYKTSQPTKRGLRRGNVVVGIGEENYGPTSTTGYVNGITPPDGGYVIYTLSGNNDPAIYVANEDIDLIKIANTLGGSVEYPLDAIQYIEGLSNAWLISDIPTNTTSDDLVLHLDASNKSSFLNYEPTTNLLEQSSATTLATGGDIYGNATKINYGNGKYRFINDGTGGSTIRLYCNLNDLTDGETYACSISYENFDPGDGSSITLDWCDQGNVVFTTGSYGTRNRISMTASRSTYDSTFRFFDISIPTNSDITLYGAQVELGTEATSYKSGNGARTQNTTWKDISGNGLDVTLVNQPTFNKAGYISFDGVDQRGDQSGLPSVDLTTDYYTIEVLCRFTTLPDAQITDAGIGGGPIYGARMGSDYQLFAYASSSAGESNLGVSYDDSRTNSNHRTDYEVSEGEWVKFTHVGIPYNDGSNWRGKFKYYINGQLDHDETISSDSSGYSIPTTFYLAYDARYGDYGAIDIASIKRYSRELTAEEVSTNYYGGSIVTENLQLCVDAGNLVSYESGSSTTYDMVKGDEGDGYGSYDSNGTLTNGVLFNKMNGGTWDFDGTNDYISFGTSAFQYQYDDAFSLEVWCNPDAVSGFKHLIGVTYASYRLAHSGAGLSFRLDANNLIAAGGTLVVGEWSHVVATYDPSTFTAKVYQNGIQVSSATDATANWTSQGTDFRIASSPGEDYYFNGKIPIGRVYNKTLSDSEVLQNFNAQKARFGL